MIYLPEIVNFVCISVLAEEAMLKVNGAPFSGPSLSLAINFTISPGASFSFQIIG